MTRQSWRVRALFPGFPLKCIEKSAQTLTFNFWKILQFGSRALLKPNFWYSSPISWVIQTLFGNFWDFDFFAHFCSGKSQKIGILRKKVNFWPSRHQKCVKNSKSQKIPNNVCIPMKWNYYTKNGVSKVTWSQNESILGTKKSEFLDIFLDFSIYFPAKVRAGVNFDASLHDNGTSFFDSVKSSWKSVSGNFRIT